MFTPRDREALRDVLVAQAEAHPSIVGAALVGSAARGTEDAWSDIDLVLQLGAEADEAAVVTAWTAFLGTHADVADTFDVFARNGVRYRVFLLASTLQVDVSFWPYDEFRATEPGFRLLFGEAAESSEPAPADPGSTIGMGWLFALHARSAIARGRRWQAVQMLDDLQRTTMELAAIRLGLNPWHGRDVDRLPADLLGRIARARASRIDSAELQRSLAALVALFEAEVARHDPERAAALAAPLGVIAGA